MKIRKKSMHLRGCRETGKWYLSDKVKTLPDGTQHLDGKIFEVTDSIVPCITHTNEYVQRLEDALISTVKELYRERGLTPTDTELLGYFKRLQEKYTKPTR